jgi:hypothetical protein
MFFFGGKRPLEAAEGRARPIGQPFGKMQRACRDCEQQALLRTAGTWEMLTA